LLAAPGRRPLHLQCSQEERVMKGSVRTKSVSTVAASSMAGSGRSDGDWRVRSRGVRDRHVGRRPAGDRKASGQTRQTKILGDRGAYCGAPSRLRTHGKPRVDSSPKPLAPIARSQTPFGAKMPRPGPARSLTCVAAFNNVWKPHRLPIGDRVTPVPNLRRYVCLEE
jgi:hypothetical protein